VTTSLGAARWKRAYPMASRPNVAPLSLQPMATGARVISGAARWKRAYPMASRPNVAPLFAPTDGDWSAGYKWGRTLEACVPRSTPKRCSARLDFAPSSSDTVTLVDYARDPDFGR
jgi:hypothetical protein